MVSILSEVLMEDSLVLRDLDPERSRAGDIFGLIFASIFRIYFWCFLYSAACSVNLWYSPAIITVEVSEKINIKN
jgi:hypothetical protein